MTAHCQFIEPKIEPFPAHLKLIDPWEWEQVEDLLKTSRTTINGDIRDLISVLDVEDFPVKRGAGQRNRTLPIEAVIALWYFRQWAIKTKDRSVAIRKLSQGIPLL